MKPIELANAYATFAAGGRWAPTRIVTKIIAPDGTPLAFALGMMLAAIPLLALRRQRRRRGGKA